MFQFLDVSGRLTLVLPKIRWNEMRDTEDKDVVPSINKPGEFGIIWCGHKSVVTQSVDIPIVK